MNCLFHFRYGLATHALFLEVEPELPTSSRPPTDVVDQGPVAAVAAAGGGGARAELRCASDDADSPPPAPVLRRELTEGGAAALEQFLASSNIGRESAAAVLAEASLAKTDGLITQGEKLRVQKVLIEQGVTKARQELDAALGRAGAAADDHEEVQLRSFRRQATFPRCRDLVGLSVEAMDDHDAVCPGRRPALPIDRQVKSSSSLSPILPVLSSVEDDDVLSTEASLTFSVKPINALSGRVVRVSVPLSASVDAAKQQVELATRISTSRQTFVFAGKELKSGALSEYHVPQGAYVSLFVV